MMAELSRINSSFFYMLCKITISISSKKIGRVTECHGKLWPNVRYADTLDPRTADLVRILEK